MRHVGMFAIIFSAGCSLVWSMEDYEGGSRSDTRDGGGASDELGRDGGSSSGSSGASSSASSSGGSGSDGGVDAGTDAETCGAEPEPNDNTAVAPEIPMGLTCGAVIKVEDLDCYVLTATGPTTINVQLGVGIQLVINRQGSGGDDTISSPGPVNITFDSGKHSLIFETYTGIGGYKIRR